MSCEGVGAYEFDTGEFNGKSFDGTRVAYAGEPTKWIVVYVDAPDQEKRDAATAFAKSMLAKMGPIKEVKSAPIKMTVNDSELMAMVDGGKIMTITSKPVLGGDGKNPLSLHNVNNPIYPVIMQAKVVTCDYHDGDKKFTLKDSNSYYNANLNASGTL
jgi:hypothetical protein